MTPALNKLQQEEIMRQVRKMLGVMRRNRTSVLSYRMTEESEKESNSKAVEALADLLKEL